MSRNRSSMKGGTSNPVEIWADTGHLKNEIDSYKQKGSTIGANADSWIRSVNQSEIGDWKNDDSIVIGTNPIYEIKMSKTEGTADREKEVIIQEKELLIDHSIEIKNNTGDKAEMNIREANQSLQQDHD